MYFDKYIGIDWSGDKNNFQKGISVAQCQNDNNAPQIVKPPQKYWTRTTLLNWLDKEVTKQKNLIGFDFAFSYPFYDKFSYFPGIKDSPVNVKKLWELIDVINKNSANLYGGEIWNKKDYSEFYNSPKKKGVFFSSRRRQTEIISKKKIHSPSATFNCVGPGAVGTGTLAGFRILNKLKRKTKIWPVDDIYFSNHSVIVEIFPTLYFRISKIKPEKKIGYTLEKINNSLDYFNSKPLNNNQIISGPDQDDADSLISAAALRHFSSKKDTWRIPKISKKEGWIFGV